FENPNLLLSWPTSAVYCVLNSATNLAAPVIWNTVTNSVTTSNGTNLLLLSMSGQTSFFRLASGVDASTMNHKLLMGYQGWFSAPGDGSAQNSWVHWFANNTPTAANATFDFWPDTSELDPDELFSTSMTYSNGSPAKLYSAYKQKTVLRHFKWMQENNLDGVFFQRFLSDLSGGNISALRNQVAINVRVGAETYGRVFAIMYDISGYATNTLVSKLTNDWLYLVNTQRVTNSPAYLHHRGKPVVAIWGFGFDGRPDTPQQAQQAIDWFKAAGCTVMGGLPTHWRTLNGDAQTNPAWSNVFRSFDIISPWSVGRYGNNAEADNFRVNQIVPDLADCTSHGIDYLPVIFPGFSWTNLN
ncbi:MAG: glycoside hydrolase family 71/99-like protein, partial [Limisphaerales bacterium]